MKIIVEKYNPDWPIKFSEEKTIIKNALKAIPHTIEHIGSTSVPGLSAKPIIDIMAGIQAGISLDSIISPMIDAGYTYIEEFTASWPERRYFEKYTNMTRQRDSIHVHIFVKDTRDWIRHLAFRNYLRHNTDKRDEYAKLKIELSQREFNNKQEYQDAKSNFIKQTEQLGLEWYKQNIKL